MEQIKRSNYNNIKMNFNVITPMVRFENFDKLKNHLSKFEIKWHIIIDEDKDMVIKDEDHWINYYKCPNDKIKFWERCNNSINWFIKNILISDDNEFYCILNDDDAYEENFFTKLKNEIVKSKIINDFNGLIICSMLRGHKTPTDVDPVRWHPTTTLIANKNNMRVGFVGVEQFIISGKLLKNHKLPLTSCGDGELIVDLVSNYKALYLSDLFVLFNYYQPGRWFL